MTSSPPEQPPWLSEARPSRGSLVVTSQHPAVVPTTGGPLFEQKNDRNPEPTHDAKRVHTVARYNFGQSRKLTNIVCPRVFNDNAEHSSQRSGIGWGWE